MGRVDEAHVTLSRRGGVQAGLRFGFEKLGLDFDVLGKAFGAARGQFRPA
jgi:hypothetical protein